MTGNLSFSICVAGISFRISCLYEPTLRMCRAYVISDSLPTEETIEITASDIEWERNFHLSRLKHGEALEADTPESLERLHLCRRISELLPRYDRVLFHGSSLAIDGKGVLFTAKSGTGKSTHSRLWRQVFGDRVRMVNDDKPFLHITSEGVTVYGTPWRGKHGLGENISAPVNAIFFVNRGEENRVERITPRELYPLLLQQTYTPEDPAAMVKTLALVEQMSRTTQLYKLYCNMDPEAALTAYRAIEF